MTGNKLKILACLFMLLDHIGYLLLPQIIFFRYIGRLALPLFSYLIAEGCLYTKNKLRYFLSLFILAILCQGAFFIEMAINGGIKEFYFNILFTLSFSVIICYVFLRFRFNLENKLNKSLDQININPEDLKQCLTILEKGEISGKQLKQLIPLLVDKKDSIEDIIKNNGFKLISDKDIIVNWIKEVQNANPNLSNNFNEKKESTIKFIAGEIMKKSKGQANPILTIELIKEIMGG